MMWTMKSQGKNKTKKKRGKNLVILTNEQRNE